MAGALREVALAAPAPAATPFPALGSLDGLAPLIETPTGRETAAAELRAVAAATLAYAEDDLEVVGDPATPVAGDFGPADADFEPAGEAAPDRSGAPPTPTAVGFAAPVPIVPSTRVCAPGSEAPKSTSGSSSSSDAISVGTIAESGRASGALEPNAGPGSPELGSSSAPCASKSSSESISPFDFDAGVDFDAGAAWEFAFPDNGISTGKSAKDSKVGLVAGSIVFEPQSQANCPAAYPAVPASAHQGDGSQIG